MTTTPMRTITLEEHFASPAFLEGPGKQLKERAAHFPERFSHLMETDNFSAETPLGERFDAKFDGRDYPMEDDPGHTMVSARLLSPSAVEIISKRNGKVVGILHLSVAPDGKSIHVVFENKESNTKSTYEMRREP